MRKQRRVAKLSKPVVRAIKRVVGSTEETKYVANSYDSQGVSNVPGFFVKPQINLVGDFIPAIPQVSQGVDDHERIGNKIQPKSLAVSLKIGYQSQDLSANAVTVVVYYGVSKTEKTWANNNPLQTAAILDDGDGTNSAFLGNRFDLTKPLDRKIVTARRKVFKLGKTSGLQNSDAGPPTAAAGNFSTSNGESEKSMLLKFTMPKTLTYQQAASLYPVNYAPWYAIGFCHTDGSGITAEDSKLIYCTSQVHMYYKDA